ncbi:MAG: DUF4065 domain-containing protein [Victivallales bacterium]|nr:DUF4065 domain-containing protein [Victivallales bacterium]
MPKALRWPFWAGRFLLKTLRLGCMVLSCLSFISISDNTATSLFLNPKKTGICRYLQKKRKNLLNNVYETYGQFSAWRLRDMTHEEKPWRSTPANGIISHNLMKEYFQTLIVEEKA